MYTANRQLFLRRLAEGEARPIPGAEVTTSNGGNAVFCAGDTAIVYWIRIGAPNNSGMIAGELRRISPTGGSAVKLATIDSVPLGLRCQDDAVLFGTAAGGIYSVALSTGKQEEVVRRTPGEVTQGPQLLPGGERVLFTVTKRAESAPLPTMQAWNSAHVVVQSRTSGERTTIVAGGADARYLPTGHLVYALNDTLYAAPFDADTLKLGTATPVLDRVARGVAGVLASGAAQWTLSGDGTMAFLPGTGMMADDLRELAIVTEAGAGTPLKLPPAGYETPRFSPDGNAVAYVVRANNDAVVATYPLRGDAVPTQLTFTGQARNPIWSSDGASVIFQWDRDGNRGLWRHRADGTGRPERLTTAAKESAHIPVGIVGTTLMFIEVAEGGQSLWIKGGTEAPRLFGGVRVPANISAAMAADGKWVAYTAPSSASISQVLMQPVPETGEIRAVSSGGRVRWPPGGNRIYYVRTNDVFASDVSKLPTVGVANHVPKVGSVVGLAGVNFDVSADGRFIVVASPGQTDAAGSETPHIQVLLNWLDELKRLVPTN